jgi:hypothetical protein
LTIGRSPLSNGSVTVCAAKLASEVPPTALPPASSAAPRRKIVRRFIIGFHSLDVSKWALLRSRVPKQFNI